MSLRVDGSSQRSSCFQAGTSVGRSNRRANSVQPHFFDSGSAAAAGGQERAGQTLFARLVTGEEGGKLRQQQLCARRARGKKKKALHRNCAKQRTEEETCARDTAQAAEAPWRRRARETARRQRKCAVSALGVEERVIARESAQGQVRRRSAFVWRSERSGHAGVCAGHTGR